MSIETTKPQAEVAIATLTQSKQAWIKTSLEQRIDYLQQCIDGMVTIADQWVQAACVAKGIDPATILAGEEWIAGPIATILNLRFLIHALQAGGQPHPVRLSTHPNGQRIAQVFPDTLMDRLQWLGFRGEVWIEPGYPATQGQIYRSDSSQGFASGAIALVLGAGNSASIPPMDVLSKLFAENQVVLLKMNPVNDYLGPYLENAFQSLCTNGFLKIVYGGVTLGEYLCQHPAIDTIHITGSHHTHDAIIWGAEPQQQQDRKLNNLPRCSKPITSELGCVTPVIVVPGQWSEADLKFQARHIASMVVHNASFNCVAAQVLVMAKQWPQREQFLNYLRQEFTAIPPRLAYYPGSQQRYQTVLDRYPQAEVFGTRAETIVPWTLIPNVPAIPNEPICCEEAFCGVLAEVNLDVAAPDQFLTQAVQFVNTQVWGNLSCVVLVNADTQRRYKTAVNQAITDLRYGAIGVNVWTGMVVLWAAATWGAFPGNPLTDIRSGQGMVHNTYLFDYPQKSVFWAPFRIWPTPIWFTQHPTLLTLSKQLLKFQAHPTWLAFLRVGWTALQG
jgi:Aldehyde dehydrogenase family